MHKRNSNIKSFSRILPSDPFVCVRVGETIYMQHLSTIAECCGLPKTQILACCDGKLRGVNGVRFCYPHSPETAFDENEPSLYGQTMADVDSLIGEMYEKLTATLGNNDVIYGTWEYAPQAAEDDK